MRIESSGRTALVTGSSQGVYLASPLASATTGAAVRVDGGYVDAILP